VQLDFDATSSQRAFYAALIRDVRAALPDTLGLSITALASWCDGDPWLGGLPVDECVPMLFRMGRDESEIARRLDRGGDLRARVAGSALGVSLDERRRVPRRERVYVFNTRRWNAADLEQARTWLAR
jgi:hypothetical protein